MIIDQKGQIGENLYSIGSAELPAWLVTAEKTALFDAGITIMGPLYLADLEFHLVDPRRLQYLFLTHAHFDHAGAAPFLKRKIPGLRIAASRLSADILAKPNAVTLIQSLSRDFEDKFAPLIQGQNVFFDGLSVDRIVEDGEEIDLGNGWEFRVMATPGHTRDAVSYYFPHVKALIPGEAAGVLDSQYNIHPEFLASYNDYERSLEKLAELDVEILMLPHQYVLTGEDARGYLRKSLHRTREFKERIIQYLGGFSDNQEDVVQKIFREDYLGTGAIQQDERSYLINLAAKVKAVAAGK
ncbi:MAG TPA: MBL fold metallo-hydrolase [Syntrophales bacterium]|nr:MBL fold metallo-hydrolase [Syntrophales bacterium]